MSGSPDAASPRRPRVSRQVQLLARVWLAAALCSGACALWAVALGLAPGSGDSGDGSVGRAIGMMVGIAVLVFWSLPLALASGAILMQREWGVDLLINHTGCSAVLWILLALAGAQSAEPLLWMCALAIGLFSACTCRAMWRASVSTEPPP